MDGAFQSLASAADLGALSAKEDAPRSPKKAPGRMLAASVATLAALRRSASSRQNKDNATDPKQLNLPKDALLRVEIDHPDCFATVLQRSARHSPLSGWTDERMSAAPKPPPPRFADGDADDLQVNRPPQRPRREYLRDVQKLSEGTSSPSTPSRRGSAPVPPSATGFLTANCGQIIASSSYSTAHLPANVLEVGAAMWCSKALEKRRDLEMRAPSSSGPQRRPRKPDSESTGRPQYNLRRLLSGNHTESLMSGSTESGSDADAEIVFDARSEWIEIMFPSTLCLSSLVVKWGRCFAEKYTVLVPFPPVQDSEFGGADPDELPYWTLPAAPPTYVLDGESSDERWSVVHSEAHGRGGTEFIRFVGGPVCARALRLRMSRPGATAGCQSLADCYFSVCNLGAVPFHAPGRGVGLRSEYFHRHPGKATSLHIQADCAMLEPRRARPVSGGCMAREHKDEGDGRFGPSPPVAAHRHSRSTLGNWALGSKPKIASNARCAFVSITGWLHIEIGGMYDLKVAPVVLSRLRRATHRRTFCCNLWINLEQTIPADDGAASFGDLGPPVSFRHKLHAGSHAICIEVQALQGCDEGIPELFLRYRGPDTGDVSRQVPASVLSPPAVANASLAWFASRPGAANGLTGFDPACREHTIPLLPFEVTHVSFLARPARDKATCYVAGHCELSPAGSGAVPEVEDNRLYATKDGQPKEVPQGHSIFEVVVVAPDLRTRAYYTFKLSRDVSRSCALAQLTVSTPSCLGGVCYRSFALPPAGNQDVIHIPRLPYMALMATITVTTQSPGAFVYIAKGPSKHRLEEEENRGISGEPHAPIPLHVGRNIVYVRVLSPDRQLVKNWTLELRRHESSDATLKVVSIKPGNFRQFLPSSDQYTVADPLPSDAHEAFVRAEANHEDAKIYITVNDSRQSKIKRGQNRVDGRSEEAIRVPLRVGWNTVYVRVVAMDNTTSKTYAVHCARRPMPLMEGLMCLGLGATLNASHGTLHPSFSLARFQNQALWTFPTDDDVAEKWLEVSFAFPVLVAGLRLHWGPGGEKVKYEVRVKGSDPRELAFVNRGEVPLVMPSVSGEVFGRGGFDHNKSQDNPKAAEGDQDHVTARGWRIEHRSGDRARVFEPEGDENSPTSAAESWRPWCRGIGSQPIMLPSVVCARELRIHIGWLGGSCKLPDHPLEITSVELVPLAVSEAAKIAGFGLEGRFFLEGAEQLTLGSPPTVVAREPSLDGLDVSALCLKVPAQAGDRPWSCQYSGFFDVREMGEYTFWVETWRFREDQTVLWRFIVDGEVQIPPKPAVHKSKHHARGRRRLKKAKHSDGTHSDRSDLESQADSDGCESISSRASKLTSVTKGTSRSGGTILSGFSRSTARQSMLSKLQAANQSNKYEDEEQRLSSNSATRRPGDRCSVADTASEMSFGSDDDERHSRHSMARSQSSYTSAVRSTISALRNGSKAASRAGSRIGVIRVPPPVIKKTKSKTGRWMTVNCIAAMSKGTEIPKGMVVPLLPGCHHICLEVAAFLDSACTNQITEMGIDEEAANTEDDEKVVDPFSPQDPSKTTCLKLNVAYRGPDTRDVVTSLPCSALAPVFHPGPSRQPPEMLRSTAPLQVHTEVADSWTEATAMLTDWMADEIFLEQVMAISLHSIEHEDDYRGACQATVVYDSYQHGGTRLWGIRRRSWEFTTDRIPAEVLEATAEFMSDSSKTLVGFAASLDSVYAEDRMRKVLPNVVDVWYLDAKLPSQRQVRYVVGMEEDMNDVALSVNVWLRGSQLCEGDILGISVHPVRSAGTPKLRPGEHAAGPPERCEWVVFYIEAAPAESRGQELKYCLVKVWDIRRTWNWHFRRFEDCPITAQTMVAYCSTSLRYGNCTHSVQFVVWMPAKLEREAQRMLRNATPETDFSSFGDYRCAGAHPGEESEFGDEDRFTVGTSHQEEEGTSYSRPATMLSFYEGSAPRSPSGRITAMSIVPQGPSTTPDVASFLDMPTHLKRGTRCSIKSGLRGGQSAEEHASSYEVFFAHDFEEVLHPGPQGLMPVCKMPADAWDILVFPPASSSRNSSKDGGGTLRWSGRAEIVRVTNALLEDMYPRQLLKIECLKAASTLLQRGIYLRAEWRAERRGQTAGTVCRTMAAEALLRLYDRVMTRLASSAERQQRARRTKGMLLRNPFKPVAPSISGLGW